LLNSLQDEIDVLNQKLQISEFELRKAERRLKHDNDFGDKVSSLKKMDHEY